MQVELRSSEMDTIEGVSINLPPEKRSAILILIICITPIIHRGSEGTRIAWLNEQNERCMQTENIVTDDLQTQNMTFNGKKLHGNVHI